MSPILAKVDSGATSHYIQITSSSIIAYIFSLSSNIIHLLSHNCPSDINEELLKAGSVVVVYACFESSDDSDNCLILIGCIEPASVNNMDDPTYGFVFDRQAVSVICI